MKRFFRALCVLLIPLVATARAPVVTAVGTCTSVGPTTAISLNNSFAPVDRSLRTWFLTAQTTSGTGSVTYVVEGCMSQSGPCAALNAASTISLSTSAAADAFTDQSVFAFYRLNCSAISGTGASATLNVGN
jgi:hypothetical protein